MVSLCARGERGATGAGRTLRRRRETLAPRRVARRAVSIATGLAVTVLALGAGAEEPAAASPSRITVGDTASALPGVARVGVPGPRASVLSLAVTGGYGLTEAQAEQSGSVVSGQRVRFRKKNQSTAAAERPERAMSCWMAS